MNPDSFPSMSQPEYRQPYGIRKQKGVLKGAVEVTRAVRSDEKTRVAARRAGGHARVVARTGAGILTEVANDPNVREALRDVAVEAAVGSGTFKRTEKGVRPSVTGLIRAGSSLSGLERAGYNAIDGAFSVMPNAQRKVGNSLPEAIGRYSDRNPGALRAAGGAVLGLAREAVVVPVRASAVAARTAYDIRQESNAIRRENDAIAWLAENPDAAASYNTNSVPNVTVNIQPGGTATFGPPIDNRPSPNNFALAA